MKKWITLLLSLAPLTLFAESFNLDYLEKIKDPYTKGVAIITFLYSSNFGFHDETVDVTMILKDRSGRQSTRYFQRKYLEDPEGDRTANIFDRPRDVKGTGILTISHGVDDDDVWIYLPVVKRVKRISSHNQSGPFMGSEFAYEEISAWEIEKRSYKYLRDEVFNGHDCFVVETVPLYKNSGYTKQVEWIDKTILRPRKIVFYDRKKTLLKTLEYGNYRQYLGQYWRTHEVFITNHQNGKSTQALFKNYRFRTGLTRRDFTKTSLKRAR
ncbi:secreted protein containing DUF1329 [Candidatus Thiomargarita nelsonii]|uniref:Secreted protein containing DUF1329 n=1 Tax=Candidatus Thiomargarita nelsonii TaxID=1003181 RepID=A0A176RSL5_9GAMM|nr:secreted protein containing DUF1329 [Candidatus Thiomargarita nelsonii]